VGLSFPKAHLGIPGLLQLQVGFISSAPLGMGDYWLGLDRFRANVMCLAVASLLGASYSNGGFVLAAVSPPLDVSNALHDGLLPWPVFIRLGIEAGISWTPKTCWLPLLSWLVGMLTVRPLPCTSFAGALSDVMAMAQCWQLPCIALVGGALVPGFLWLNGPHLRKVHG